MLMPTSTRNKNKNSDKHINSGRFLKKFSTDENEKNIGNYLEKVNNSKHSSALKKTSQNKKKLLQNHMTLSSHTKPLKTLGSVNLSVKNIDNKQFIKDKSYKNLKINSSTEFPKILVKSISQTTIHKKLEDKNLKLLDKVCTFQRKNSKAKKIIVPDSPVKKGGLKINQFQLGKKLGNGRFGSVYIAQEKLTKSLFAIKVLNKQKIKEQKMEDQIMSEIKLQLYMNHPNILKLFGCFDDQKNIYLILEYCSSCLFRDFRSKGKLEEEQSAYFGKQAVAALKYMHNQYIIHRDIKPENILVQHGVLKLSDFGWSTYSPLYKRQTFCGTVDYVPPEIVEGVYYDQRVDIWALGVLLYELSSGRAPFENKHENITYERIVHSQCKYPSHFSSSLKDLLSRILDKNPKKRPNLNEIQSFEWFQKHKTIGRYINKHIWNSWSTL